MTTRDSMEDVLARAEKAIQQLREERAQLEQLITDARGVAQDLLNASRLAREEIRQSSRQEARKQLASQLARMAEQLRIKDT